MPPPVLKFLAEAVGFVGGALVGYWLGRWLGFDLLRDGWDNVSVIAIAAVGLCGGIGLGAGRRWAEKRGATPAQD